MLQREAPGSFLVRISSSQPGKILCVRGFHKVLNYIVFKSSSSGLFTLGKSDVGYQGFATELALLDYYFTNSLPHSDGGSLVLLKGVVR